MSCFACKSQKSTSHPVTNYSLDYLQLRLSESEKDTYISLFNSNSIVLDTLNSEKKVIPKKKFPKLLGLFGTDIAEEFAFSIFDAISDDGEYLSIAEYLKYVDIYHHGDINERCLITFKLMDKDKKNMVSYSKFKDYLNLILSAIEKVQPQADSLLSNKEIGDLFNKISLGKEHFTFEDFKHTFINKPELLSWIDYFKNNDEDLIEYLNLNIKSILIMFFKFFYNINSILKENNEEKDFSFLFRYLNDEMDVFNRKMVSKMKDLITSNYFSDIRSLFNNINKDNGKSYQNAYNMDFFTKVSMDMHEIKNEIEEMDKNTCNLNNFCLRMSHHQNILNVNNMKKNKTNIAYGYRESKTIEPGKNIEIKEKTALGTGYIKIPKPISLFSSPFKLRRTENKESKDQKDNKPNDETRLFDSPLETKENKEIVFVKKFVNKINGLKKALTTKFTQKDNEKGENQKNNDEKSIKDESSIDIDERDDIILEDKSEYNKESDKNNKIIEKEENNLKPELVQSFKTSMETLSFYILSGIKWIDCAYHWIEKKYDFSNLNGSNSNTNMIQNFSNTNRHNLNMNKKRKSTLGSIRTSKYSKSKGKSIENGKINNSLKTTDENFKLLIKTIMGIQLACHNTPIIDLINGNINVSTLKNYLKNRIYTIEDSGSNTKETYYICEFSPVIFNNIRNLYGISKKDYIDSISPKGFITELMISSNTIIEELFSTSKSGSMFFYTKDGKFIIKTLPLREYNVLKKILIDYFLHLKNNSSTFLPKYFGLYKLIKYINGKFERLYFITTDNLFSTPNEIKLRFDLKGSTVNRRVLKCGIEEELKKGKINYSLKDLDMVDNNIKLTMSNNKKEAIFNVLNSDSTFLKCHGLIDYSLLVGIHYKNEGVEEKDLKADANILSKEMDYEGRGLNTKNSRVENICSTQNMMIVREDNDNYDNEDKINHIKNRHNNRIDLLEYTERFENDSNQSNNPQVNRMSIYNNKKHIIYDNDDGAILSTKPELYYMGIIDILTEFSIMKGIEYTAKTIINCNELASCVPPNKYKKRFVKFIEQCLVVNSRTNIEK